MSSASYIHVYVTKIPNTCPLHIIHIVHVLGCISLIQDLSEFLESAVHELPTKSRVEIEQHKQWYTEYLTLLSSKKQAIEAWKTQKQVRVILTYTSHINMCTLMKIQYGKRTLVHTKAHCDDTDLLDSKSQDKREKLFTKEREERFAKLLVWKVS